MCAKSMNHTMWIPQRGREVASAMVYTTFHHLSHMDHNPHCQMRWRPTLLNSVTWLAVSRKAFEVGGIAKTNWRNASTSNGLVVDIGGKSVRLGTWKIVWRERRRGGGGGQKKLNGTKTSFYIRCLLLSSVWSQSGNLAREMAKEIVVSTFIPKHVTSRRPWCACIWGLGSFKFFPFKFDNW